MKATIYRGLSCSWCDRVKTLLKDNDYEIEEIMINKTILEEIQTKYDTTIRTVPQVIIDDAQIGGFAEVRAMMRGINSINKV